MNCGNCTECCRHLNIPETDSPEGELCKHCDEGVGCKIYDERPEPCQIFECCWRQMEYAHIDLRPDNCGVLFEKWTDKVIVGSTNDKLSDLILRQLEFFQREGISTVIIRPKEKSRTFYLAEGNTIQSVEEEIKWRHQNIQKT